MRPRPGPTTMRPRPKMWSRDHAGLETLTSPKTTDYGWASLGLGSGLVLGLGLVLGIVLRLVLGLVPSGDLVL